MINLCVSVCVNVYKVQLQSSCIYVYIYTYSTTTLNGHDNIIFQHGRFSFLVYCFSGIENAKV